MYDLPQSFWSLRASSRSLLTCSFPSPFLSVLLLSVSSQFCSLSLLSASSRLPSLSLLPVSLRFHSFSSLSKSSWFLSLTGSVSSGILLCLRCFGPNSLLSFPIVHRKKAESRYQSLFTKTVSSISTSETTKTEKANLFKEYRNKNIKSFRR